MATLKSLLGLLSPKKNKERIQVQLSNSGNGFTIPFKNGDITISDQADGYVVSCGCGTGKTESIKSLIRQRWNKGILYCVDTKSECSKMYNWIMDNLVGEKIGKEKLRKEDILLIHGDADFEDMNLYRTKPEELLKRKIILITHVRFMTDMINAFLIYQPLASSPVLQLFDGDFTALMGRQDLRAYILFDETPLFFRPFTKFPKPLLGIFSEDTPSGYVLKDVVKLRAAYEEFLKGTTLDFYKGNSKLDELKRETMLKLIPKYYDAWRKSNENECAISFTPSELIVPDQQSHVIIYEGVGDALFNGPSHFKLLDLPVKYNSPVDFKEFDFSLTRKKQPVSKEVDALVDTILGIYCNTGYQKFLLVVWKDFKDQDAGVTGNTKEKSQFVEELETKLIAKGIPENCFDITYYGASDTKSTNGYRHTDVIILCGTWDLPVSTSSSFSKDYHTKVSQPEYKLWYMTQLVLRIGIRNHDGRKRTIYYSSDYSKDFIQCMDQYLNQNRLVIPSPKGVTVPTWKSIVLTKSGCNKYSSNIEKLITYDPGLENAIMGKTANYTLSITLTDIDALIPMKGKKQKSSYDRLAKFMKERLGINLVIQTNWGTSKKP